MGDTYMSAIPYKDICAIPPQYDNIELLLRSNTT